MGTKKKKKDVGDEEVDPYSPSAPMPTGTIPRHGHRPPQVDTKLINGYHLEVAADESIPTAPPVDLMDSVVGYETVSFAAVSIPPPELPGDNSLDGGERASRPTIPAQPQLTEQQARRALLKHVSEHFCYGKGAAKNMAITKICYSAAFHYELQTFTEKRETSWAFAHYSGGDVDGPAHGPAPLPWDIPAEPTHLFHNEVKVIQVPHTASVKQCHCCKGTGSLLCNECHGKGWLRCLHCQGEGWANDSYGYQERCFHCHSSAHGHGRQDCLKCHSKGRVGCVPCDGYGQIKCYIQLTITWKTNNSEHIVERTALPEDLVRRVSGQIAFEEEGILVAAINHFPDETINIASAQLVHNHTKAFHDQRVLSQRQQVRIIPVTEISYEWERHNGKFYVYGYENKIHAPDYPQTCCCGCSIL